MADIVSHGPCVLSAVDLVASSNELYGGSSLVEICHFSECGIIYDAVPLNIFLCNLKDQFELLFALCLYYVVGGK